MKPNELRIGNLIQDVDGSLKATTTGMLSNWEILHNRHGGYTPIPLTEEWLERFGFVFPFKDDKTDMRLLGNDGLVFDEKFRMEYDDEHGWQPYGYYYGYHLRYQIKYVHTLQNLYFALTGEELTLKDV